MKNTKKILFICLGDPFTPTMYYKENYYIRAAREEGFRVYVLADDQIYKDGKKSKASLGIDKSYGYQIKRVKYHKVVNEFLSYKLREYDRFLEVVQKLKPDYIFFNTPQNGGVKHCGKIKRMLPDVKIYLGFSTFYGNSGTNFLSLNLLHRAIYGHWLKKAVPYVDKIYYICNDTKKFIEEVYGLKEKLELMVLPAKVIEKEEREKRGFEVKRKLGIKEGQVVFCHSGKMDRIKKSLELIRMFSKTEYPEFRLLIAGKFSDDIAPEAMDIINSDKRIIFLSFVSGEELTDILCATDVYIQPASVSQTAETAICCGCPIIFENNSINREIYNDNGYLIDNLSEMGQIFEKIHKGETDLGRMQEKSYKIAKEKMDYRMQFRKMIDMVPNDILKRSG